MINEKLDKAAHLVSVFTWLLGIVTIVGGIIQAVAINELGGLWLPVVVTAIVSAIMLIIAGQVISAMLEHFIRMETAVADIAVFLLKKDK